MEDASPPNTPSAGRQETRSIATRIFSRDTSRAEKERSFHILTLTCAIGFLLAYSGCFGKGPYDNLSTSSSVEAEAYESLSGPSGLDRRSMRLPIRRGGRKAPEVPRRVESNANQPVLVFFRKAQIACDLRSDRPAARKILHSHPHARFQRLRQPDATPKWIDQYGVAARGEGNRRIETCQTHRNLRSNSRSVPSLNQVGHDGKIDSIRLNSSRSVITGCLGYESNFQVC